jgi:hypothetical protein
MAMDQLSRRLLLSIAPVICAIVPAHAEGPPLGRRIAIGGYDPVSYFADGQPQKGNEAFWFAFDDAIYLFKSAEHRAQFAADPERYAPQYNGFCAGGLSKGYKVEPDPEAWAILNGKLYLFQFKDRVPNFKQDTAFIDKANSNWPSLKTAPVQ